MRVENRPALLTVAIFLTGGLFWLLLAGGQYQVKDAGAVAPVSTEHPRRTRTPATPSANSPIAGASTPLTASITGTVTLTPAVRAFVPLVLNVVTPSLLPPPLPPPIPMSSTTPIDFAAVKDALQGKEQDLAFVKIGFHVAGGGNASGLDEWMVQLDAAGVPFFLKSVDSAGLLFEAQQLMDQSGVPHTLVYRRSGSEYDVPNYDLPPEVAAQAHWERHKAAFPPELDPSKVWIETVNEVDKNRAEWFGRFALKTAELALADGFKWAAFGWASGEPETMTWEAPSMLAFLRLVGRHPEQLAIALHEYSYSREDAGNLYPYLVGRFQQLFQICDAYRILRPTVLITEWGWESTKVPATVEQALAHIQWASWLYAAYPQVRGAAIWYLGPGYGGIADQAQKLIAPVGDYSLRNYFIIEEGRGAVDPGLFQP